MSCWRKHFDKALNSQLLHLKHGIDAREAVDHDGDKCAVTQADEGGFHALRLTVARRVSLDRDTVEQLTGLVGRGRRRLASFDDVFGAAHGMGRINIDHVADDQLAAAVGKNRRTIDQARTLLRASASGEPFDPAALWDPAAKDRGVTVANGMRRAAERSNFR